MGSEVFDDVAFYYVLTAMIACTVVPATIWVLWSEFSHLFISSKSKQTSKSKPVPSPTTDKDDSQGIVIEDNTGVQVDRLQFIQDKLKARNVVTTKTWKEKYLKKRYLFLILGWAALMYLLFLAPSMQTKGFVVFEPYSILGVELDATEAQIKRAYRKLAMQWHPDKHRENKEEAENKFTLIAKAYAALTDPRVKANMERFGNPDGVRQAQSMTYGLPEFLSDKGNELYVLIGYFLLFIVIPPTIGYYWWKKTSQFHESGVLNNTIGWYAGAVKENQTFNYIIEPFCIAAEFRKFDDQNESKINALKDLLNGKLREFVPHQYDKIYYIMTTSIVLHAHMQRVPIDPILNNELQFILSKLHTLAHVLVELSRAQRYFTPAMAAIDLMQNATQGVWSKDSPLMQLPHITDKSAELLRKKGISTIPDFRAYSRNGIIKILNCSEAEYEEMAAFAKVLPVIQLKVNACVPEAEDIRVDDIIEVTVDLIRREDIFINEEKVEAGRRPASKSGKSGNNNTAAGNKSDKSLKRALKDKEQLKKELQEKIDNWEAVVAPQVKAPTGDAPYIVSERFHIPKKEVWYVFIVYVEGTGSKRRHVVVDMRTLRTFDDVDQVKFVMRAPDVPGQYNYEIFARCDSYVGCDVVQQLAIHVDPATSTESNIKLQKKAQKSRVVEIDEHGNEVASDDDEDEGEDTMTPEDEEEEFHKLFEEDEDEDYVEVPGKWYYLGAPTFLEFLVNLIILGILAYAVYTFLHGRGIWQKFVEPVYTKVWKKIGPTVEQNWEIVEPVFRPIITIFTAAINRFLGVDIDLPLEIKIDKLQKARGRGMF